MFTCREMNALNGQQRPKQLLPTWTAIARGGPFKRPCADVALDAVIGQTVPAVAAGPPALRVDDA